MKKPRQFELPDAQYLISESDIMDILIAYNNQDYEWILYFFETLVPVQDTVGYTFEEILRNAGITFQGK